ncbi:hypothetical protein B296_00038792 [Ensete ventricosum]|uniref:Uncharacterized protein n=1 Tax=Ensete ventricosum TaxID=4639 RepID=A0A426XK69_ENSVE|nr:hypothetical protein B296_00038792 [Ensete ventricosum]
MNTARRGGRPWPGHPRPGRLQGQQVTDMAPSGPAACDQGRLQGQLPVGATARSQGCCQQARPPASMASTYRGGTPWGRRQPTRETPEGITPVGATAHLGNSTCCKGGRPSSRLPLDEGRRGEL